MSSDSIDVYTPTKGDKLGLIFIGAAGLVSLAALVFIFRRCLMNVRRLWGGQAEPLKPVDFLILALFTSDILQAIGGALNFHWVIGGKVEMGGFCTAQGVIQTLGETGVALANIMITTFTVYCVIIKRIPSMRITLIILGLGILFLVLMVALGTALHRSDDFIDPTPFWCWIGKQFFIWKLFSEYLWLWLGLFLSMLGYPFLFFFIRNRYLDPDIHRVAKNMLWYPLVYAITILPFSVVRWIGFVEEKKHGVAHTPNAAVFALCAIFTLSGLFNVVLFVATKPNVGLFQSARQTPLQPLPLVPIVHQSS